MTLLDGGLEHEVGEDRCHVLRGNFATLDLPKRWLKVSNWVTIFVSAL